VHTSIFLSVQCSFVSVDTLLLQNLLGLKLRYYVARIGGSYRFIGMTHIIKRVHLIKIYNFYMNSFRLHIVCKIIFKINS